MKHYRITRRKDGAVVCWVQPSTGERYALPFAPVFSRLRPFIRTHPAYAGMPHSGYEHLTRALLANHLGPQTHVWRRMSVPALHAFSAQFFREQDPLCTIITGLKIDAWRLSWQANSPSVDGAARNEPASISTTCQWGGGWPAP